VSPRKQYILFSTKNPPAVQRIPWPEIEDEPETVDGEPKTQFGTYETWIFNDHDFDFFVDPDGISSRLPRRPRVLLIFSVVTATKILYSRATGVETWITSDGRAYFVGLTEHIKEPDSPTTARHHQVRSSSAVLETKSVSKPMS
jgi:hypothetical protein